MERFLGDVERLSVLAKSFHIKQLYLNKINNELENIIKQAEAIDSSSINTLINPMEVKFSPGPNEKLDCQWKPKKLFQT